MFGEGDDDGEVGFGSPSFSLMNGTMQDVDQQQQQMMMQTQQQTQQQQQYGDTQQQQQSIGDDEFQQQQQLQFQKRSLSTSNASLMQFRSGSMNNLSSLLGGQQDEFGDLNDFNSSSTNTTIQGSSNSLTSSLNNLKQSQSNFARPATQRPLSRSMEDDQLAQQQQQQLIQQQQQQQQQQDETNEDQQEEEEENEEQEEEEEDEEDEDGNPSQPQQPVSSRGLRMPIGRAVPANEENEEEDENEQEGEEEEDEEEEEEEDPITREQHFFELSKKQYESMLASDPNNATVKQRLQELYVRHNEFLARHNRPIAEQPDAKRQKLS